MTFLINSEGKIIMKWMFHHQNRENQNHVEKDAETSIKHKPTCFANLFFVVVLLYRLTESSVSLWYFSNHYCVFGRLSTTNMLTCTSLKNILSC